MKPRQGRVLSGALLAIALLASACGGDDDAGGAAGETSGPTAGCPAQGGSLTVGTAFPTAVVDPTRVISGAAGGGVEMSALYGTLMRFDQESGEFVPEVAESVEANNDLTEWTVHLRPEAVFGNGDPLDAEAVKFSVERHQAPDVESSSAQFVQQIVSIDVIDEVTVRFTLEAPSAGFPAVLADSAGMIVNPAIVQDMDPDEFATAPPAGAGAGPFELVTLTPNEETTMRAKEDYWGDAPCLDELRFVSVEGGQATFDAFSQGELAVAFVDGEATVIDQIRQADFDNYTSVRNSAEVLKMNHGTFGTEPITRDVRIRQAIAMAIDQEEVDLRVDDGLGLPHSGLLHPDSGLYSGVDGPALDPDEARALVDEVKAEGEWDGTIRLAHLPDPRTTERAITAEAMLENVGFDVDRQPVQTVSEIVEMQNVTGDYDLVEGSAGFEDHAPLENIRAQMVRHGYSSPEMDDALAALAVATTPDDVRSAMAGIQEIFNQDVPWVSYGASEGVVYRQPSVHGLEFNQEAVSLYGHAYVEG